MRARFSYIFIILVSILWAASPVHAASAKIPRWTSTTVAQACSAIAQQGRSQHCGQLEDTEVITAAYNKKLIYAPDLLIPAERFNTSLNRVAAVPLPDGRDNARMQPFYRLILFPFHGFW